MFEFFWSRATKISWWQPASRCQDFSIFSDIFFPPCPLKDLCRIFIVLWALNMLLFCFSPVPFVVFFQIAGTYGREDLRHRLYLPSRSTRWLDLDPSSVFLGTRVERFKIQLRLVESYPLPYSMYMGNIYIYIHVSINDVVYLLVCMGNILIYI